MNENFFNDIFLKKEEERLLYSFNSIDYENLAKIEDLYELLEILKYRREIFRGERVLLNEDDNEKILKYYFSFYSFRIRPLNFAEEVKRLLKKNEIKDNFEITLLGKIDLKDIPLLKNEYCIGKDQIYRLILRDQNYENEIIIQALSAYLDDFQSNASPYSLRFLQNKGFSILSLLDFPSAVFDRERNLILYNDLFLNLKIHPQLLYDSLSDGRIEVVGTSYQIITNNIDDEEVIFLLIKQEKEKSIIEEKFNLEVTSGSIFHELNNPIAGILAALNLIELEKWSSEDDQIIKELRKSVFRCKDLIEIFLGFSKYQGECFKYEKVSHIIDKVIFLMRYRMIESAVSINFDISKEISQVPMKSVSMSIILYLILDELIMMVSYQRLTYLNSEKKIDIEIRKEKAFFILEIKNVKISKERKKKFDQKLIDHFLEIDKISKKVKAQNIYFEGAFASE